MEGGWQQWQVRPEELDLQGLVDVAEQFRSQGNLLPRPSPGAGGLGAPLQGQATNGGWGTMQNHNLPFVHLLPSQALTLGGVGQHSLLPDPDPLQRVRRAGSAKPISLTWPGAPQALDQQGPGLRDDQHWDSGDGSVVQAHDGGGGDVVLGSPTHAVDEALCHREKNRKAQRKFRERQKAKLADSEAKVADLTAEMERLKLQMAAVETRNAILEKVLTIRMQEGTAASSGSSQIEEQGEPLLSPATSLTVTVRPGEPQTISMEQMKAMSWEEAVALWKEYVQALGVALVDATAPDNARKGTRLDDLVDEVIMLLVCLNAANPKSYSKLRSMDMEGGGTSEGRQPTAEVIEMLKACNFTAEQRRIILSSRRQFLIKLGAVLSQRQELSQELLAALPVSRQENNQQLGRNDVARCFVKASEAADRLRSNLREEQDLTAHFTVAIRSLLTPYQTATCVVRAYPYCPDALQIFNLLAEEINAPSAEELLMFGQSQQGSSLSVGNGPYRGVPV